MLQGGLCLRPGIEILMLKGYSLSLFLQTASHTQSYYLQVDRASSGELGQTCPTVPIGKKPPDKNTTFLKS